MSYSDTYINILGNEYCFKTTDEEQKKKVLAIANQINQQVQDHRKQEIASNTSTENAVNVVDILIQLLYNYISEQIEQNKTLEQVQMRISQLNVKLHNSLVQHSLN